MNKEETKRAIEVMQAYVNGDVIQSSSAGCKWHNETTPAWNWMEGKYRVKPEPKEFWMVHLIRSNQNAFFATEEEAKEYTRQVACEKPVLFREVLEE